MEMCWRVPRKAPLEDGRVQAGEGNDLLHAPKALHVAELGQDGGRHQPPHARHTQQVWCALGHGLIEDGIGRLDLLLDELQLGP